MIPFGDGDGSVKESAFCRGSVARFKHGKDFAGVDRSRDEGKVESAIHEYGDDDQKGKCQGRHDRVVDQSPCQFQSFGGRKEGDGRALVKNLSKLKCSELIFSGTKSPIVLGGTPRFSLIQYEYISQREYKIKDKFKIHV